MPKKSIFLFYGSLLSLAILVLLFATRQYRPSLLDIDTKWLVVAGVPLLIALIAGRYISKFKGFGMDIEIAAEKELMENRSVITVLYKANVKKKGEEDDLYDMSKDEQNKCTVLAFQFNRPGYYEADIIRRYLEEMKKVTFFEITDAHGHFEALMKINRDKYTNHNEMSEIIHFIELIARGQLPEGNHVTRKFVYDSNTVIGTLEVMHSAASDFVAVLDGSDETNLIGVAFRQVLEKTLINAVLKSWKKK